MMQLTFQPAFDPFHAIFRLLRLLPIIAAHGPLHRDHVRILDFYLLFPFRIEAIRLTPQHRRFKKLSAEYKAAKPYGDQPEDHIVFNRMEPMENAAFEMLAARELLSADHLAASQVAATSTTLQPELAERIDARNARDADLMEFLETLASEYELMGPNGLKGRTALLEYRYDPI